MENTSLLLWVNPAQVVPQEPAQAAVGRIGKFVDCTFQHARKMLDHEMLAGDRQFDAGKRKTRNATPRN